MFEEKHNSIDHYLDRRLHSKRKRRSGNRQSLISNSSCISRHRGWFVIVKAAPHFNRRGGGEEEVDFSTWAKHWYSNLSIVDKVWAKKRQTSLMKNVSEHHFLHSSLDLINRLEMMCREWPNSSCFQQKCIELSLLMRFVNPSRETQWIERNNRSLIDHQYQVHASSIWPA